MRGRLAGARGLVLGRRPHREADRVAAVFSAEFGKIPVRFPGVDRPTGKLRAMCEPLVHCDLRVYVRQGAEYATAAGGSILTAFPALRAGLGPLMRGLGVLELLDRLTPWWQASAEKFELTLAALTELERRAGQGRTESLGWVYAAYGLRLFEAAGYGMAKRRVSEENRALWDVLHGASWETVSGLPADEGRLGRLEVLIGRTVETAVERPLRSMQVRERMREASAGARVG
ncbi:MAG: recombination protein O N-terminal domain-containing protein [Elusimicrobia bacterium]|nr:recombination protein O N-terminal domain-containing protein [Elusimicrobiota bacterium]